MSNCPPNDGSVSSDSAVKILLRVDPSPLKDAALKDPVFAL